MAYQSEAALEQQFIEQLNKQEYTTVAIPDYDALVENFKVQFEAFNAPKLDTPITDKEWERIFNLMLGKSVFQSAKILRDKFVLEREDGTKVYLSFFDQDHTKNIFQVTHQTTVVGKYVNRYDVTILVNGLPLIQVELKRRGIDIREAVNQVMRYKKHSYNGLYHFIQLFIVSNGVDTKYFANSDRDLMYILGMIFYYYLSDRTEKYMANLLKDDGIGYEEAWADEEYKTAVIEEALRDLGYVIEPQYLFRKMVKMVENRSFDIEFLQSAINALMESTIGNDSQEDFDGLFSDMQLDSSKLGHTVKDRSAVMAKIIASLDEINFGVDDTKIDVLGNAYEYLIAQFAATAGKKAGEFYTPSGPAELLCRLACLGLTDVKDAADPTCGSGSLLLRLKNYANVRNYYGQELTSTTYNLARMNMILRGVPYRNFNIYNGDTLEHDYFGDMKFRVQVANPPYSANWSADMHFMEDERFNEYGKLAPKSKADFAFVQHMVYHMDEDGRAVVLLPHGVLFRGAAEEVIRKHLIQKLNVLDAVIGLPANLFFGTGIPVCVLVLKRERNGNSDNILFIDASSDFEAGKNQNILRECDIDKIVETYERRQDVDKYAHVATMQEIEENGFNLNIPRYVDTFEPEPEIDLNEVAAEIRKLQSEIKDIDAELKPFFDELGLDFPFDVEGK